MNLAQVDGPETALSFDSEHRLRSENLCYDIDCWYPILKDFTFISVFLPLKKCEALSIRRFHDVSWRHSSSHLSANEIDILKRLEDSINDALTELRNLANESLSEVPATAFLRLCGMI